MAMADALDIPRIETAETGQRIYQPDGKVLWDFFQDRSHVSIIRGGIGSGTSTCCCMKIYTIGAIEQHKGPDGKRRSRWVIVRTTYPELKDTTLKTWLDWFPEEVYGRMIWSRPMCHEVRIGDVEMDVHFLALDDEGDVKKLRSLELTGAWINEAEFMNKAIVDEIESRTGRYPAVKDGGSVWDGVIMDMNAPSEDHWIPRMMGDVDYPDDVPEEDRISRPHNWAYFVQPPGLIEIFGPDGKTIIGYRTNPKAENLRWLKKGYYEEKIAGKDKRWIDSRVMNRITFVVDGEAVWPAFNPDTHMAPARLTPVEGHDVWVGLDFGRRPSAICMQEIGGRIFVQMECRGYGMGAATFAPLLKRFLTRNYPRATNIRFVGDPKGRDKGQNDDRTAYEIFAANGMVVMPAPVKNNNLQTRLSVVESVLNESVNGLQRLCVSPEGCPTFKAAMMGRYRIKKQKEGDPEPLKDKYSDIADAFGYALLGMGEGRRMVGFETAAMPKGPLNVRAKPKSMRRGI
jgi:hypothetical protein